MRKKLNIEGVVNELSGASAFFRQHPAQSENDETSVAATMPQPSTATVQPVPAAPVDTASRDHSSESVRSYGRPYVRRKTARYAFEFYADQLDALKQFSLREQLAGGVGNMSSMVREALDAYIVKRTQQEAARTDVRAAVRSEESPPQ